MTVGKPLILGRKTFDSIGRALPDRITIVLSGRRQKSDEGTVVYVASVPDALAAAADAARQMGADEIMVAGGEQVFRALLPAADRLYLTEIDMHVVGDAHFPAFDEAHWEEAARQAPPRGPADAAAISFVDMRRVRADTPL